MKLVIIGGGAGGSGFAAETRRLDEKAEIIIFEKSPYASYSNCGQPYLISGRKPNFKVISGRPAKAWKEQFNVDLFVEHEVIAINKEKKFITVMNLKTKEKIHQEYDKLVISAGAPAIMPGIPGITEATNVHALKTPDQLKAIMNDIDNGAKKAVVIGGGFIGLELAENCKEIGMDVTVVDAASKLMAKVVDEDFSVFIKQTLIENGIKLKLNAGVVEIKNKGKQVILKDGTALDADIIFMVVGTSPVLDMYKEIGLEIGVTKGIVVDKNSLTNDENIYAIGDIAQTVDWLGNPSRIQLSMIAHLMASMGAHHIKGIKKEFKGVQNSASISLFGNSLASVGYTEEYLKTNNIKFSKVLTIGKHALIDPKNIYLKVMYDFNGLILGAQAFGPLGAEKRINYAAMAQMYKIPVTELSHFQVAYNPVIDTQRDPINVIGRIAESQNNNIEKSITAMELDQYLKDGYKLIDVRPKRQYDVNHIKGSTNVTFSELSDLDKKAKYVVCDSTGARAFIAKSRMRNYGFKNVASLMGGLSHYDIYSKYKNK